MTSLLNPTLIKEMKKKYDDFNINIPVMSATATKEYEKNNKTREIKIITDNKEDETLGSLLAEINKDNNIILFRVLTEEQLQQDRTQKLNLPSNAQLKYVESIKGMIHNTVLRQAHHSDLYILGINNMIDIAEETSRIYENIKKRDKEIKQERIKPTDQRYSDIHSKTEIEFSNILNKMEKIKNHKLSTIYNTIISEKENFVFDGKTTYLQFPVGNRIKSSGFVMTKENLRQLKKRELYLKKDTTEYPDNYPNIKENLTSIADQIKVNPSDVDISKMSQKMAQIITSKENSKKQNLNSGFTKYLSNNSEQFRQYT